MATFTLDPNRTALVVIDLTKGVLSLPSVPHTVQEVLANTVRLADTFRSTGSFVVLVNVNSVDGKDMLHPITDAGFPLPAERPKDWAKLAPELGPQPFDHLITKHQWGASWTCSCAAERSRPLSCAALPLASGSRPQLVRPINMATNRYLPKMR